jgi:mycothiol system anti-sigma-R factor
LDCRQFEEKLWAFLDGELDDGACAELQSHLEACPECLGHYRFEDALKRLVQRCCCEPAPELVRRRLIRLVARLSE